MDLLWAVCQLIEKAVFAAHDGFATGSTKEPAKEMEEASKDQNPAAASLASICSRRVLDSIYPFPLSSSSFPAIVCLIVE